MIYFLNIELCFTFHKSQDFNLKSETFIPNLIIW